MKRITTLIRSAARAVNIDIVRYRKPEALLLPLDFTSLDAEIIRRVSPYTYTSAERVWALCNGVRYIVSQHIPGAMVECGVWRGGSVMAAMLTLLEQNDTTRECYLYDTFEGMTEPTERDVSIDGHLATARFAAAQQRGQRMAYSSLEEVTENIHSVGYPTDKIRCVKGKVEESIPKNAPEQIAMLRLDTDWYESTRHELIHLYPRLAKGGVIIIDDYGHWRGARQAVDEYLREHDIRLLLNRVDYTCRIGVKS